MSESPPAPSTTRTPAVPSGRGLAASAGSFGIWGLFPLYLKLLQSVAALQIVAHRVAWSCLLVFGWLIARGELSGVRKALAHRTARWGLAASAVFISINWLVYVWAVTHSRIVETSLGYFINPLVNVVLGVVVLSERLNRAQWTAVGLATIGVAYLTLTAGQLPWISLVLAMSFGLYGLIRKVISVDAVPGLAAETLMLAPIAVGYLVWSEWVGTGALGHSGLLLDFLLIAAGPLTAVPLILFAYGARRIPYSTVGLLQYIAPTLQLAIGVLIFGEPFGTARAVGFAFIWTALVIYATDGLWRARR